VKGPRFFLLLLAPVAAWSACRDCAQPRFGGPGENRFTAYDAICRGDFCREPGIPQAFVNVSNLTLFVRVTDLPFGGGFALERSFHMDDTRAGAFGVGWSFNLGDSLTIGNDGSVILRRGSGREDSFAAVAAGSALAAVTATGDTLASNGDGSYTLRERSPGAVRTFSPEGRLVSVRYPSGETVLLEYNGGRLSAAKYRGRSIRFSFDGPRIGSVSDTAGRTVSFFYRGDGRLVRQVNADGRSVGYEYDGAGNLTSIKVDDSVTAIEYAGEPGYTFVNRVTLPDGSVREYDTPIAPSQVRLRDGAGDATWYVSGASGLLQSVTDAIGNRTSFTYDASGRRTKTVDATGAAASFVYDAAGNLTGVTDAAGNRWSATYTAAGIASLTDPNGNTSRFQYDDTGNLATVVTPAGATSASRSGKTVSVSDPLGNRTIFEYNDDGLVSTYIDPLNGRWRYEYDGAARPVSRTDPAGSVLEAGYSQGVRITKVTARGESAALDAPGLLRDALQRIAAYTDDYGNSVGYTYDNAGQLASMTLPGGKTVSYQYDRAKRLARVSDWLGNFAIYRYDAAGFPVSTTVSGGPVTIYQYDTAHRLRAIVSTGPDGKPLAAYRYTLDGAGNRTSVSALEPSAAGDAPSASDFSFNAANRPTGSSEGQSFRYDARGNLVAVEGPRAAALVYDAFGRLQSADAGGAFISSGYDSAGLRISRSVNGSPRRFVYDLSGAQPRVVMEADESNTPLAWYVYGLGLLWKVMADGSVFFYHFDGDGNTVAISSPSAGVVNSYRYDPAGRLASRTETIENPFRARGESGAVDDGNGLIYSNGVFQFPELRLILPASADPSPPLPRILPKMAGAGACFFEGIPECAPAAGRRAQ
jgi:YD repeat-containing protein